MRTTYDPRHDAQQAAEQVDAEMNGAAALEDDRERLKDNVYTCIDSIRASFRTLRQLR